MQEDEYWDSEKALWWLLPFSKWEMDRESEQASSQGHRRQFENQTVDTATNPESLDWVETLRLFNFSSLARCCSLRLHQNSMHSNSAYLCLWSHFHCNRRWKFRWYTTIKYLLSYGKISLCLALCLCFFGLARHWMQSTVLSNIAHVKQWEF